MCVHLDQCHENKQRKIGPFCHKFHGNKIANPTQGEGMAPSPTCQIRDMAQTTCCGATTTCEDCRETMPGGSATVGVSVESIINWPLCSYAAVAFLAIISA